MQGKGRSVPSTLCLVFLYRKGSFRPKAFIDIRKICRWLGFFRDRSFDGFLRRIGRFAGLALLFLSFGLRNIGNEAPPDRLLLDFQRQAPRVHNEAVDREHPDSWVLLYQLRQLPFQLEGRHRDHPANFTRLVGRRGWRDAEGSAQLFGSPVDRHGFVEYEVVGTDGIDDARCPGIAPSLQQRRRTFAA